MRPLIDAVRRLERTPGVSITIALTLALGIGLASASGVIARVVAFAGLPVSKADRVVVMWGKDRAGSFSHLPLSPLDIGPLSESMKGVASLAASDYSGAHDWLFRRSNGDGTPFRLRGTLAGGNLFDLLGTQPLLGRALRPEDDVIGAPRVLVLNERTWRSRFGADPSIVGTVLHGVQQGAPYTIVGVMPAGLDFPRGVEFWSALAPTAARNGSLEGTYWAIDIVARLAPGATAERARQLLDAHYAVLSREGHRQYDGARASVRTLPELVSGDVRPVFGAFGVAGLVVLLVTCGNVVALLLVRASRRRRELAVRTALGAPRGRLVRELLTEHAVLAVAGGILGAASASIILRSFVLLAPSTIPRMDRINIDGTLLLAAIVATALVVLITGVAPAFLASRTDPAEALGPSREGAGGGLRQGYTQRMVVAAQVAAALVVLVAASLGARSLARQASLDLGMSRADQLAFVELAKPEATDVTQLKQEDAVAALSRWRDVIEQIVQRSREMPGIVGVAPVTATPFAGEGGWDGRIGAVGAPAEDSARRPYLNMEITNASYLEVTGLELKRGRWLQASDREDAPRVIALSEGAARALFPGEEAVGRRVQLWAGLEANVIGLVADTRYREFLQPRPSIYFPFRQFDHRSSYLVVRAEGNPARAHEAIQRAVTEVDAGIIVQGRGTMRDFMGVPLSRPRLLAAVLGVYGIIAGALALSGLYAVIASGVTARRREFGVRTALGATPRRLVSLVVFEAVSVVGAGVVAGLLMFLALSGFLGAMLHGVPATDPATLALVCTSLIAISVLAVAAPARRAGRVDPARELRSD